MSIGTCRAFAVVRHHFLLGRCLKRRAALGRPCSISTTHALSNLIEVVFGPGRRAVPPLRSPDVLQVAEEPGGRKLPEVAPVAPQLAEGLDGRKPPEAAPVAELLVSQRRPAVG